MTQALRDRLKNVHAYAVTPFTAALSTVDVVGFRANLEFMVERGVQVVAVGGGTGEIEALTPEELETVATVALDSIGDRALVVACLPANYGEATTLAGRYQALGIEVLMATAPQVRWRTPADLEGTFSYYRAVADSCELPLLPYRTQPWSLEFIVSLADIGQVIGLKDPCRSPHEFFQAIQQLDDRFVWIGNKQHDPGVLHLRYQMGIDCFTSGQLNFWPDPELQMHEAAQRADWPELARLQARSAPLERVRKTFDDTAMLKAAMDIVGLSGGSVRPPRRNLDAAGRRELDMTLSNVGVPRID